MNEITYSYFYSRKLFASVFHNCQQDVDGLMPHQRMLIDLHKCLVFPDGFIDHTDGAQCSLMHTQCILEASSVFQARKLWKQSNVDVCKTPCVELFKTKGIAITKKRKQYRDPSDEELIYARRFWNTKETDGLFEKATAYKKVFFDGEVYTPGDHVVVRADDENPNSCLGHWKAQIKTLFSLQYGGHIMIFFGAEYYKQHIEDNGDEESLKIDHATGMSIIDKTCLPYNWNCVRPINWLLHKFIPIPRGSQLIAYEMQDLNIRARLLEVGYPGCVPPWFEINDVILIECLEGNKQPGHVYSIDSSSKSINVNWLKRGRASIWKIESNLLHNVPWNKCICRLEKWHPIKYRTIREDGHINRVPTLWYNEEENLPF